MTDEPREIYPIRDFTREDVEKDFSIRQVPSDEVPSIPKGVPAQGSAVSSTLTLSDEPTGSETPAPTPVDKESGATNEPNAVENPELFLPTSSSETSPGWPTPSAPDLPPTSDPNPKL